MKETEYPIRIAVDLDNTLCKKLTAVELGSGEFNSKPIEENIKLNNKLYTMGHTIIIHTARPEYYRYQTMKWLMENNVWYHCLVMTKLEADIYIDDKSINVKEFSEMTLTIDEISQRVKDHKTNYFPWFDN